MKKKMIIIVAALLATPVFLIGALYIALSVYYSDGFMSGTFINGMYATGLTVEEMNDKLLEKQTQDALSIVDREGEVTKLKLAEIDYTCSYMEPLEKIHREQNPFLWFRHMEQIQEYSVAPTGSYDEKKLDKRFKKLSVIRNCADQDKLTVEIRMGKDGYELVDTTDRYLDKEKCKRLIEEALQNGVYSVDLFEEGCYKEFDYTGQMKETIALYKKLDRYLSSEIIYKFDDAEVELDRKKISEFFLFDENGEFALDEQNNPGLDEEAVGEYVRQLAERFDTVKREREFLTTRGDTVVVPAGTYGNKLDQEKEKEYLMEALSAGRKEQHEPIYSQRAWGRGDNDIGTTYIEVDLTNQMLYYYKRGSLILSANVVTGNTSKGNGTPQKACYVYFKQKNRVLRGEDYETPVDYWMAVYGNIGIHDAKWRGRFGGSIYKTNGSHGCINTPYKEVSKLYGEVEVGTPVMIFY
ncbi:MAG: L,D-transpeptidase/peptidoglycan binding protein [Lachnospiraceae bacterium]|nr:L,D-transpeptidase/peptidoglycan binding protein [Lachnospiraceae bacterium]